VGTSQLKLCSTELLKGELLLVTTACSSSVSFTTAIEAQVVSVSAVLERGYCFTVVHLAYTIEHSSKSAYMCVHSHSYIVVVRLVLGVYEFNCFQVQCDR
jgi:hypothetical protein